MRRDPQLPSDHIQALEAVLEVAVGTDDVATWAEEQLLEPIGMANSSWITDPSGNANMFLGVQSNCLDLARFGTLFLAEGSWDGNQLVSADWVAESTMSSQELTPNYGYLWWLNTPFEPDPVSGDQEPPEVDADGRVIPWPDAPLTSYSALGLGGQVVHVQPETGIVFTRIGIVSAEGSDNAMFTLHTPFDGGLHRHRWLSNGVGEADAASHIDTSRSWQQLPGVRFQGRW